MAFDTLFDPVSPVTELLGSSAVLSEETAHQQAAFDAVTGEVYVTQVIQSGRQFPGESEPLTWSQRSARGDLAISRVSPDGTLLGAMWVLGFDHGNSLGVQQDYGGGVLLWTSYDAVEVPEGRNAHGRRIARFGFTDGAVLRVGDPGIEEFDPFPGETTVTLSLDEPNGQMGVRYDPPGGDNPARYRIFGLNRFESGDFSTPLADLLFTQEADIWQSWSLHGRYLYELYGFFYSDTNPPPGNSWFAIRDITTGRMVRKVFNDHRTDLPRREPEALTFWESSEGTRLVFGFSISETLPRRMSLFATGPEAGPGTFIHADPQTGIGVALTIGMDDAQPDTRWSITRLPGGADLFTGTGADLTSGVGNFLDSSPVDCRSVVYRLEMTQPDGTSRTADSPAVTYFPPQGCGGVGAVTESALELGCAQKYVARFHWRGGGRPFAAEIADHLTSVRWSRTLNDMATAEAVFARGPHEDCCQELANLHDWVHELTIYRDRDVVWQGPIQRIRVSRDAVTVEAADMTAWLENMVNTFLVRYVSREPDSRGRRLMTPIGVAAHHIALNMTESSLSDPPDDPALVEWMIVRDSGLPERPFRRDGTTTNDDGTVTVRSRIWAVTVADIMRELAKLGLRWTTVGRSLFLRSSSSRTSLPIARLGVDDFTGEVELIRDGTELATDAFATTQQGEELSGTTVHEGRRNTAYWRVDRLVQINQDDASEDDLAYAARTELQGRYPSPVVISMPGQAALSPRAPVVLGMLVPGERIDVIGTGMCLDVSQGFLLTDVEGAWEGGQERITLGLASLPDSAGGNVEVS